MSVTSTQLARGTASHNLTKSRMLGEGGGGGQGRTTHQEKKREWRREFDWVLVHDTSCLDIQLNPYCEPVRNSAFLLKLSELGFICLN